MEAIDQIILVSETCYSCGVVFGLNNTHKRNLLRNGNNFYCPNGHEQHYTKKKTLEKKLKEAQNKIKKLECRVEICKESPIWEFCDWRWEYRLKEGGVTTIGDALKLGESGLENIYGIGRVCISQINENLRNYNVELTY